MALYNVLPASEMTYKFSIFQIAISCCRLSVTSQSTMPLNLAWTEFFEAKCRVRLGSNETMATMLPSRTPPL